MGAHHTHDRWVGHRHLGARGPGAQQRFRASDRTGHRFLDEAGSAVAEFALVAALLTILTLSVIQLALALHVRNTVIDAASEGARFGALADNSAQDGVRRTRELITTALGPDYAAHVTSTVAEFQGVSALHITVSSPLPVFGLLGAEKSLEVTGHARLEAVE